LILVDTSVWSLAFRRRGARQTEPAEARLLRRLILEDVPLAVPGIVLQELLSGLREQSQMARLQTKMSGFPPVLATRADHLEAARLLNDCRRAGVACTTIDALVATLAIRRKASLFTADRDFTYIAEHTPLRLLEVAEDSPDS
jgi:predicted nucleic acid-binding protein